MAARDCSPVAPGCTRRTVSAADSKPNHSWPTHFNTAEQSGVEATDKRDPAQMWCIRFVGDAGILEPLPVLFACASIGPCAICLCVCVCIWDFIELNSIQL